MMMQDTLHIAEEDLLQYALGTLREMQLANLTAHLSMCNECRATLAKIQVELASFAAVQPQTDVPSGARERFLKRLSNSSIQESRLTKARDRGRLYLAIQSVRDWLQTPMPLRILSGALAAALAFTAYDDLSHIHQIRQLLPAINRFEKQNAELVDLKSFLAGAHTQKVSLHERPQINKTPEGHTIYSAEDGKLVFTASNFATPPAGKAYELWILPMGGGKPIPAGVFSPDMQGNAAIVFPQIPIGVQAAGFGVTLENEGGSPVPTSAILVSGA